MSFKGEYSDILSLIAADSRGDSLDGDNFEDDEESNFYASFIVLFFVFV